MKLFLISIALLVTGQSADLASSRHGIEANPVMQVADPPQHRTLWSVSIAAMAGAEVADAISTRQGIKAGRTEANPLMRSDGVLIKTAAVGAVVGVEWLLLRHRSKRAAVVVNFVSAGALAGIAARNWRIK